MGMSQELYSSTPATPTISKIATVTAPAVPFRPNLTPAFGFRVLLQAGFDRLLALDFVGFPRLGRFDLNGDSPWIVKPGKTLSFSSLLLAVFYDPIDLLVRAG